MLLSIFQGISQEQIGNQDRHFVNQGIQHTWDNSAIMGFISAGIFLVLGILIDGPVFGALVAISGGGLVWAISGGLAVPRHYVIRLLLSRSHSFPWHAPRFLEDATTRILLRRVGGGYSFPHRLLLDYFADLDRSPSSSPLDGATTESSREGQH